MISSPKVVRSIRQTGLKAGVVAAGLLTGFGLMGLGGATTTSARSFCSNDMCDIECEWSEEEGMTCWSDTCEDKPFSNSYCDFQPEGSCVMESCDPE